MAFNLSQSISRHAEIAGAKMEAKCQDQKIFHNGNCRFRTILNNKINEKYMYICFCIPKIWQCVSLGQFIKHRAVISKSVTPSPPPIYFLAFFVAFDFESTATLQLVTDRVPENWLLSWKFMGNWTTRLFIKKIYYMNLIENYRL